MMSFGQIGLSRGVLLLFASESLVQKKDAYVDVCQNGKTVGKILAKVTPLYDRTNEHFIKFEGVSAFRDCGAYWELHLENDIIVRATGEKASTSGEPAMLLVFIESGQMLCKVTAKVTAERGPTGEYFPIANLAVEQVHQEK
ncbi:MAG TPA: hypothetical protein P5230_01970 [Candidatus Magasanikbacteria bacterium]|nr:hypothetical protein [Candidatus Magasanikbacteria bacterium]